jgi:hypothetical protein
MPIFKGNSTVNPTDITAFGRALRRVYVGSILVWIKYVISLFAQLKKITDPTIIIADTSTAPSPLSNYIALGLRYEPVYPVSYNTTTNYTTTVWRTFTEYPDWEAIFKNFMNYAPYRSVWLDSNGDGVKDPLVTNAELTISKALTFQASKTILIGIIGDNKFIVKIDGTTIVESLVRSTRSFNYLHIFPVTIQQGTHLFSFTGIGDGTVNDSLGVIVWDNKIDEIFTPVPRTSWRVLYSSEESLSQSSNIVTCPIGYSYDQQIGKCVQITTLDNYSPGDTVIITPDLTDIPSEKITAWSINFADGNSDNGTGFPPDNFQHIYAASGTYNVVLTLELTGYSVEKSITVTL